MDDLTAYAKRLHDNAPILHKKIDAALAPTELKKFIVLTLPFTPSVNHYWRHTRNGRVYISPDGEKFAADVEAEYIRQCGFIPPIKKPVSVKIILFPPDRRRRDLDNQLKALFDALTKANVWDDDSQVHKIEMEWDTVTKGGKTVVAIKEL